MRTRTLSSKSGPPRPARPIMHIARTCAVLITVGLAIYLATRTTGPSAPPSVGSPAAPPLIASPAAKPASDTPEAFRLERLPGDRYRTPAGLIFGPSRGEHRMAHVMRHAQDAPGRSGPHGVFDLKMAEEIAGLIDEAYVIARKKPARASVQTEGDRTIYTVHMDRRIGYLGGSAGQKANHPACQKLTLVLEGENVITAYPVR